MNGTWLVLDSNYLCWRAFYAMPKGLTYKGQPTGMYLGFFRTIVELHQRFDTENFVFCFDSRYSHRKELCSTYKANRKRDNLNEKEQQQLQVFYDQVKLLRRSLLPRIGFRNVFIQRGYEADDLIAQFCDQFDCNVVVVSSDNDLLQVLRPNVRLWNPHTSKMTTHKKFIDQWNIDPVRWSEVKAVAGCSSDCVAGIKGIGEKTAVEWVAGRLNAGTKKYVAINENLNVVSQNMSLVRLPLMGTYPLEVAVNEVTSKRWDKVMLQYGLESLFHTMPKRKRVRIRD